MTAVPKQRIMAVMLCHFIAALSALGMPPFFASILADTFQSQNAYLVGWFYILPTFCTAMAAPWWGRFADRWGKRISLLRAQLGLAAGFALASVASSPAGFALALVVQGVLGGTFAASNAYLATQVQGHHLAQSLTWMQASARAAMVVAPILFGWLMTDLEPLQLYGYLAWLPLLAAVLLLCLPAQAGRGSVRQASGTPAQQSESPSAVSFRLLFVLQFGFSFACVISFPYFIADMQARFTTLDGMQAAMLFSLPHLVYLLLAHWLGAQLREKPPLLSLCLAFGLLALSMAGQGLAMALPALVFWRVLMGIAMTAGFVALHQLMSGFSRQRAGRTFGWLDAASKWAGVSGGLIAGAAASLFDLASPLLISAVTLILLSGYLLVKPDAVSLPRINRT